MTTQARIDANRLNAQKSTGPKTPEGKARVALNALKHGIRAKALVASLQCNPLFDDDPQAFADLVQSLVDHFHPDGPIEEACVEDIAICQWRLRRIICAETGHIASAQTVLLSGPGADNPRLRARNGLPYFEDLEKLNRYEISIQRQLKRSIDTLTALIRERRSNGGQSSSGSPSKQKADRDADTAGIRREVLGYLLDELGSNGSDPERQLAVPRTEVPNESNIESGFVTDGENPDINRTNPILSRRADQVALAPENAMPNQSSVEPRATTIAENSNLHEQSQVPCDSAAVSPADEDQPAAIPAESRSETPAEATPPASTHLRPIRTDSLPCVSHVEGIALTPPTAQTKPNPPQV